MANSAMEIGTLPEIGEIPENMRAWVIRKERHGEPLKSFQEETVPVPKPGPDEVLVLVMAAGVNFNGVWAGLGEPISVLDGHKKDFHIAGSDAAGIVWAVGSEVKSWKPGDEVIIHCNIEDYSHAKRTVSAADFVTYDPMASSGQRIWGYETPNGSFAQFTCVQAQQILSKPAHLTWEAAASYGLCYFTAYRMLVSQCDIQPGELALVWGGAGGLGVFAIQICKWAGADAIAVVSSDDKAKMCMELGAKGTINRRDFPKLMYSKDETPERRRERLDDTKKFGKAIWDIMGERKNPNVVFEHPGEGTFPASVFVCNRFGRVVICAGTTGYDCSFDVRYLWMHQKRIIGSHFANALECVRANALIERGIINPVLSETFEYKDIPLAHQNMYENKHSGKMAVLVQAPRTGLRNQEETRKG